MTKKEFNARQTALRDEIARLKQQEIDLRQQYGLECLERSGYHIGDRVTIDGVTGEIVGIDFCVGPYAAYKRVKKDGTLSSLGCNYLATKLAEI